jgi:hypothetical protein
MGASEIELNIHVISDIILHLARYGPAQELTRREVKNGKGSTRSMDVGGIKIDKWEPVPFEEVETWITVPEWAGKYLAWITSFAPGGSGSLGVNCLMFTVKHSRFRVRRLSYVGTWRLRVLRWFASPNPYDLPPFPSLMRANWQGATVAPPRRESAPPIGAKSAVAEESDPPRRIGGAGTIS